MTDANDSILSRLQEDRRFAPPEAFRRAARVGSREAYDALYRESLDDPQGFWTRETAALGFRTPWTQTLDWKPPHARWFEGATLNVSESCLDRHLKGPARNKAALIWEAEPEDPVAGGQTRTLTYFELHREVVRFAGALATLGVKAGDRVVIYMGMVPEVVVAMLACARLGAVHSVVFGGFAAEALRDRINDCGAKLVVTQDGAYRRGNLVKMKATVDAAVAQCPTVERVVTYRRLGEAVLPIALDPARDLLWEQAIGARDPALGREATVVPAEHPLFILYTSGSTGKPKGVLHTSAGYLAG
ncbi:MAG TPA: AMP-binding protein, partial [Polyangiaceae bacterium]|nr:AMP-binding protein [Polyangiaceae bacterium]